MLGSAQMRFSYAESMCDPEHYLPLARACDSTGWSSFVVPDSVCYPRDSDSKYPYTPDGDRRFLEDRPFFDPFVLSAALGAVTTRLRFNTFVVKLPIRHPVLAAKSASSVACLTQNRFAFGVGSSPWPDDFRILGVPWRGRGKRMDEAIEIIRGLCRGGYFEFHGEHFDLEPIKICPTPSLPIPILIGGHSEAALRRAASLGDGWMHAGGDPEVLARYLLRLKELRREAGRADAPFEIHVISLDAYTLDGVRRLEDAGVTDLIVGFRDAYRGPDQPLQEKIDALRWYADEVISKTV